MQTKSRIYTVVAPEQAGTYFEQFGWRVVNTETGWTVCSGDERLCHRWARELNR